MNDVIQPAPDFEPLPNAPANSAVLATIACADRVHTRMKLNYDVTDLHEQRQRLLLHLTAKAVKQLGEAVAKMPFAEVTKALGQASVRINTYSN